RCSFAGTAKASKLPNLPTGTSTLVLPPDQRAGNFPTSVSRQLIDQATGVPFPGNIIPASRIDPATQKLLPLIPVSFSPDGQIFYDRPQATHENQYMGRADYYLTKHRLYARYFYTNQITDPISGKVNLVASGPGFNYLDHGIAVNYTYTPGPAILNNLVFAFNRNDTKRVSAAPFGVNTIGVNIAQPPVPEISLSVNGYFSIATGRQGEFDRPAYH